MNEKNAKITKALAAMDVHAQERHAENLAHATALRESSDRRHSEYMERRAAEARRLENSDRVRTFV